MAASPPDGGPDPAAAPRPGGGGGDDALPDADQAIEWLAGDRALYDQILAGFAADHAGDVQSIETALARGDADAAVRCAHTLKGLAATLGARHLAGAALALETAIRGGAPPPRVAACLAAAAGALRAAIDACGRRLAGGSAHRS
jgi:HPt (histidine-containing phosphotransfer) domain-containing protein